MDLNEAKIIAEMNHDGFPLGKIMAMYPVTHDALNWALGELEASKTATDYAALEAERDSLSRRINPDGAPVDVAALCLEIDAVTDERDEWRRERDKWYGRCDALMDWLMDKGDLHDQAVAHLAAIAEGRDNG